MKSLPLFLTILCLAGSQVAAADKPNLILIMADDLGWGDVHSHGNDLIDTPVLDRLAANGARFERFFVSPVCSPTRAALLTGRYYLRTGTHHVTRGWEAMRSQEVTLAEAFQAAGYATGCFGKWHNGRHVREHPNGQGFEEFFGFCGGHCNRYFDAPLEHNGLAVQTSGYITDVLTDAALRFIEAHRSRPFFCYVPFNAPHSPFQVPDRYFQKYKDRGLSDKNAAVYGMCENLDENIGRLLAKLDQLDLARDTIVLFLSDNGPNDGDRFNGAMKGIKGSGDEGGVRVPLFVRWPGHIRAGTVVKPIASDIDLFPTLLDLCGLEPAKNASLDGVSLAPLLRGQAAGWPDRKIFTHWSGGQVRLGPGAVRTERWRAVLRGTWQLYDMPTDPSQTRDVAGEHPEVLGELAAAYKPWFDEVTRNGFAEIPAAVGDPRRDRVELPAHEATLHPAVGRGIGYVSPFGWANEWITAWTDTDAYPSWTIDVVRPGRYEVSLAYCCPQQDVGARISVQIGQTQIEGTISRSHDPALLPEVDRFKQHPTDYVTKTSWADLVLGEVELPAGVQSATVRALTKPGRQVMELHTLRLRRLADATPPRDAAKKDDP